MKITIEQKRIKAMKITIEQTKLRDMIANAHRAGYSCGYKVGKKDGSSEWMEPLIEK